MSARISTRSAISASATGCTTDSGRGDRHRLGPGAVGHRAGAGDDHARAAARRRRPGRERASATRPRDPPDELARAADEAGVAVEPGDIVLIRTGWGRYFGIDNARYLEGEPGIDVPAARWLTERGVAAIGCRQHGDRGAAQPGPPLSMPVHQHALAEAGVYLIENLALEALAADKVARLPRAAAHQVQGRDRLAGAAGGAGLRLNPVRRPPAHGPMAAARHAPRDPGRRRSAARRGWATAGRGRCAARGRAARRRPDSPRTCRPAPCGCTARTASVSPIHSSRRKRARVSGRTSASFGDSVPGAKSSSVGQTLKSPAITSGVSRLEQRLARVPPAGPSRQLVGDSPPRRRSCRSADRCR